MDPLAHWIHQDNCIWRSIGWIIPIEAGVLAGAFARPGLPGLCVVLLGSVLVVAFWMYAWKSGKDRDLNRNTIEQQGLRLTYEAPWYCKGSFWIKIPFTTIILANVGLSILEICQHYGYWTHVTTIFFPYANILTQKGGN